VIPLLKNSFSMPTKIGKYLPINPARVLKKDAKFTMRA